MRINIPRHIMLIHKEVGYRNIENAVKQPDEVYLDEEWKKTIILKKIGGSTWVLVVITKNTIFNVVTAFLLKGKTKKKYVGRKLIERKWRHNRGVLD